MSFKPMLAPNEKVDLDTIQYPLLASYKLDGIRCIFKDGEMLSRSLKQIQNKQLHEKFQHLKDYSKEHNVILDGELYAHDLTFQEITRYVMTQDFTDKKSIKKFGKVLEIPSTLQFHCFDMIIEENYNETFTSRAYNVNNLDLKDLKVVLQFGVFKKDNVEELMERALEDGYEGLILKSKEGRYKTGRGTIKEGLIYKVKPYRTLDAEIKGIVQATKVDPNAEKKINELGRSVTSKKKGDRILIEKACDFVVDYEGLDLKVVIALTDIEKEEIWKNKESYIGRIIEYKGMLVGSKDLPRHPVFVRYREDKDEK